MIHSCDAYSGWRLKDTSGPSCLGLTGFGSQLDLVTALGSKEVVGKRASSKLSNLLLYMYGAALMLTDWLTATTAATRE